MTNPLEQMLGVEPETVEEPEVEETEEAEVDDEALKYEAGKKALRAERKRVRELEAELKAARAGKTEEDASRAIRAEVAREFGLELAKEKAERVLLEQGYKGNPSRGAKVLDLASVLDENGKVNSDALGDLVADWKEDEPQLFKRSRAALDEDDEDDAPRRKSSGSADLGRKPAKRESDNPLEAALSKMVGNPRLQ